MNEKLENEQQLPKIDSHNRTENLEGYPLYPENEDIYTRFKKSIDLKPDEIAVVEELNLNLIPGINKIVENDLMGSKLDFAEAELKLIEETIELENKEENYFSLNSEEIEEDQG